MATGIAVSPCLPLLPAYCCAYVGRPPCHSQIVDVRRVQDECKAGAVLCLKTMQSLTILIVKHAQRMDTWSALQASCVGAASLYPDVPECRFALSTSSMTRRGSGSERMVMRCVLSQGNLQHCLLKAQVVEQCGFLQPCFIPGRALLTSLSFAMLQITWAFQQRMLSARQCWVGSMDRQAHSDELSACCRTGSLMSAATCRRGMPASTMSRSRTL